MKKILEIAILLLILAAGFYLRFWGTRELSFNVDEAISTNAAINILKSGKPYVYEGSSNIYDRDPLHTYAIAGGIKIFGNNEGAARIPFVICGLLGILGIYWLARILTKNPILALLSAAVITFSVWAITTSHMARMYELYRMLVIYFFVWVYFFLNAEKKGKKIFFVLLMILFAMLSFYTHRSAAVLFLIIIGIFVFEKRDYIMRYKKQFILLSILLIVQAFLILLNVQNLPMLKLAAFDLRAFSRMKITGMPWQFLFTVYPLWFFGFWFLGLRVKMAKHQQLMFWLVALVFVIVDMLIYTGIPLSRARYIQFIVPIFFIFATYGIFEFYKKYPYKRTMLAIIILALLSLRGFTIFPSSTYQGLPEVKIARDAIELKDNDIIIGHPVATVYYYFGRVDYWLVNSQSEIKHYSQNNIDYYGGAAVLTDLDKLKTIIENHHGYIVIEDNRWHFIDLSTKSYIEKNVQEMENVSTDSLYVGKF